MINPIYSADKARYSGGMKYRRCGKSGILLPEVSLGLWHNFGDVDTLANSLRMAHFAFDKSHISTWLITTVPLTAQPKKRSDSS